MSDYNFAPVRAKFVHIAAAGTTVVRSGPGTLFAITVNNPGTGNTVTVYDNTAGSGTVIAILAGTVATTLTYNLGVATGITVVSAGGTAMDLTITYL